MYLKLNKTGYRLLSKKTAYALGYYDVPRKISSDELSRQLNVDKSTIVEHLRKAERKLIDGIITG